MIVIKHDGKVKSQTKSDPDYNVLLPNCDRSWCPLGALAHWLGFLFGTDKAFDSLKARLSQTGKEWDWSDESTWRCVRLISAQKAVNAPVPVDSLTESIGDLFKRAGLSHLRNKAHLMRHAMTITLGEMGIAEDQIARVGHWRTNVLTGTYAAKIPRTATLALAGFHLGESHNVPELDIDVPQDLQALLFPWLEGAIASLNTSARHQPGTLGFFQLLLNLRIHYFLMAGHLWRDFRTSRFFKNDILERPEVVAWMSFSYPSQLKAAQDRRLGFMPLSRRFDDERTNAAFNNLAQLMQHGVIPGVNRILARTEQFSPTRSLQPAFAGPSTSTSSRHNPPSIQAPSSSPSHYSPDCSCSSCVGARMGPPGTMRLTIDPALLDGPANEPSRPAQAAPSSTPPSTPPQSSQSSFSAGRMSPMAASTRSAAPAAVTTTAPAPASPTFSDPSLVQTDSSVIRTSPRGNSALRRVSPTTDSRFDYRLPPPSFWHANSARPPFLPPIFHPPYNWSDILDAVHPDHIGDLWNVYGPRKPLSKVKTVKELVSYWEEPYEHGEGMEKMTYPALSMLEDKFAAKWRAGQTSAFRQLWLRFTLIPRWLSEKRREQRCTAATAQQHLNSLMATLAASGGRALDTIPLQTEALKVHQSKPDPLRKKEAREEKRRRLAEEEA